MKVKRQIAFITLLILILNILCPNLVFFRNESYAGTGVIEENPFVINNLGIKTVSGKRILTIQLAYASEATVNGFMINFKTDMDKLQYCRANGNAATLFTQGRTIWDDYQGTLQNPSYDKNTGLFTIVATEPAGGIDAAEYGFIPGEYGDDNVDVNGAGFAAYYPILNLTFLVKDDSITADNITLDMFEMVPNGPGLATGLTVNYTNGSGVTVDKAVKPAAKGFATAEKNITEVTVKDLPTKTTYDHGDSIDLTGGTLHVKYDDSSEEDIDMTDSAVSITSGDPANISGNGKVRLAYKGFSAEFNITVLDPFVGLSVNSAMATTEFSHGDTLDFTGLSLKATKKSGDYDILTYDAGTGGFLKAGIPVTGITISENTANINSTNFTAFPPDGTGTTKGIQKIEFTYEGFTADATITVNDTIDSVSLIDQPTKKLYKYGETLNLSGAKVKVNFGSGNNITLNLPDGNVAIGTFSNSTTGSVQHLSVGYGGKTASHITDGSTVNETIDVEVYDYVTTATFTPPTKDTYKVGDSTLSVVGGRFVLNWKSGKLPTTVSLTTAMVSGFDTTSGGTKTLTATYDPEYTLADGTKVNDPKSDTFEIEVERVVSSVAVTTLPTKSTYNHGDAVDPTGGQITVTYTEGTPDLVAITTDMIKEAFDGSVPDMSPSLADYTSSATPNKISKMLKITYSQGGKTGQANYPIEIINDVKSIVVQNTPKTSYNLNETLDKTVDGTTPGTILVTRAQQTASEAIDMTDARVSFDGFNTSAVGTGIPVTVKFTENGITKSTSYNIDVADNISSLTINTSPKTNYKYGESLDVTGGTLKVVKGSGTTYPAIQAAWVTELDGSAFDSTQLGTRNLKVTYDGETVEYQITVKDYVKEIKVNPDTVSGNVGKTLADIISDNNIEYTVSYAKAGDQSPTALTAAMVSGGYSSSSTSTQNLSVDYVDNDSDSATYGQTISKPLTITLSDGIDSITVTAPTKTVYKHGEALDVTGGTITVNMLSGTSVPVTMTTAMITEADGTAVNMSPSLADYTSSATPNKISKTLKIEYTQGTKTGTVNYPIEIINDVQSIAMQYTPKQAYNVNEPLDLQTTAGATGTILVTRAVGPDESVDLDAPGVSVTGFDSSVEYTTLPLTVKYTENGITQQTTYDISVTDSVTGVVIKTTPKQNYLYDEPLDVTGGVITVTRGSGPQDIPMTTAMVTEMDGSAFDPQNVGTRNLKVTYGGQTATYSVTVKDYVTGIKVSPASVSDDYNTSLSDLITNKGITYTVTYKSGDQSPVALDPDMVTSTYDPTQMTVQTLTVKYTDNDTNSGTLGTDFTTTFDVTLGDEIDHIEITAPSTTTYKHGESLNLAGGTINKVMLSGTSVPVTMTTAMITEADGTTVNMSPSLADYTSSATPNKISKTLKIEYTEDGKTGTVNYPIEIINDVQSIAMENTPKQAYNVNDPLDLQTTAGATGTILVTRAVGTPESIDLDAAGVSVTGFDSSVENTSLPITVKYTENGITEQTTYNVSVTDSVTGITLKTTPKQNYLYDEPLDVTGGVITVTKGSGPQDIPMTTAMVTEMDGSAFDPQNVGTRNLKVTYGGQTATYSVTVKDYVTGIKVSPASVSDDYNTSLSDLITNKGITYTVSYKSGDQSPVALDPAMVTSTYDPTDMTVQTLTVKYTDNDTNSGTLGTDFTTTFDVTLGDEIDHIEITAPSTTTYKHGESLNIAGGTINKVMLSGTTVPVTMTTAMVTEMDGSTPNMSPSITDYTSSATPNKISKTLKIEYTEDGKTGTVNYPIEIINDVQSITMQDTPKQAYNVGDAFDLQTTAGATGTILVTRAVGTPESIDLDAAGVSVTGFDSTTENASLPITVKYTENGITQQTSYNVSVTDAVTGIVIKTTPKQNYKYDEPLDVTGGVITVTKGSGPQDIPMTTAMVTEMDGSPFEPQTLGTRNLKVTYGGQTATYSVTVKDYVTGITLNPATITGSYNDELTNLLSTNTVQYTVNYASGAATSPVAVTDTMVTGYDKTDVAAQNLSVKYTDSDTNSATAGTDFTATLTVTLSDDVSNAVIETTPKTNYEYGDSLDVTGGTIRVTRMSGDSVIPMTSSMVTEMDGSPFDSTQLGTRNLKVTYGDQTMTYEITVVDKVTGVILTPPTKDNYNYGEALDLTGGSVQKVMASGATTPVVPLTDPSVTVSGYNPTTTGAQTVTVTYAGTTKTFPVTVEDGVASIVINPAPTKTTYKYGESLNTNGGKIKITRASGAQETKDITVSMVTGYNPNNLGNQTLTVTYQGKTATYNVEVEDYVDDIVIVKPTKTVYKLNESLDLTGGTVKTVMASGAATTPVAMTSSMITGFNSSTEGAKTLTVNYKGKTKTFGITVTDPEKEVKISSLPNKTDYKYGESLDVTGGKIAIVKESGKTTYVNMTKSMVSGFNPKKLGNQKLTVTYEGKKVGEFIVNVEDYVSRLTIKAPTKTKYNYGQDLDLTNGTVSVIMASGNMDETVPMTASMLSGFNNKKTGTQTVNVKYKGLAGNFTVTVVDEVKGIKLNTKPDKTTYEYGEKIDVTGGTLKVTKDSGTKIVNIKKSWISGYNPKTPGTQVITVTYEGKEVTFKVKVKKEQTTTPKKEETPKKTTPKTTPTKQVIYKPIYVPVPSTEDSTPTTPVEEPKVEVKEEIKEEPKEEVKEEVKEETKVETPVTTPRKTEEPKQDKKPIKTLGVKEENTQPSEGMNMYVLGGIIAAILFFLLLLVLFLRRNVKIYVTEDSGDEVEFELGGKDRITKRNPRIDVDQYLDTETYPNKVEIVLKDSISKKLDGEEIEVLHRGATIRFKVKYNDEPFVIILD